MLSKISHFVTYLLIVTFWFNTLYTLSWGTNLDIPMDVENQDALQGRTLGKSIIENLNIEGKSSSDLSENPQSGSSIFVPFIDDARQQRGNYDQYYSNPSGAESAGQAVQNDAKEMVEANQDLPDLSKHPVFGNQCLAYVGGECVTSSGYQIVENVYMGCDTITVYTYDEEPHFETCETERPDTEQKQCTFSSTMPLVVTSPEYYPERCSDLQLDVQDGQIYTVCRDQYKWYFLDRGPEGCDHFKPETYTIVLSPSDGAVYAFRGCMDNKVYDWYGIYRYSKITIVEGITPGPPASDVCRTENIDGFDYQFCYSLSTGEYTVSYTDDAGEHTVTLSDPPQIQQDSFSDQYSQAGFFRVFGGPGISAPVDISTLTTSTQSITVPCNQVDPSSYYTDNQVFMTCYDVYRWEAVKVSDDIEDAGGCPATDTPANMAVQTSSPPQNAYCSFTGCETKNRNVTDWYAVFEGSKVERIVGGGSVICEGQSLTDEELLDLINNCEASLVEICNGNDCTVVYELGQYQGGAPVCTSLSGSLEQYNICFEPQDKTIVMYVNTFDGAELQIPIATTEVNREDGSCQEFCIDRLTYFRQYGGNVASVLLGAFNFRVLFSCHPKKDPETGEYPLSPECQALEDQGCTYWTHECLDEHCKKKRITYRCGGTGLVNGEKQTIVCPDMRCLGTECTDASYTKNKNFQKTLVGAAILDEIRYDTEINGDDVRIFPGEASFCRTSSFNWIGIPDCCDTPGAGPSLADYIMLANESKKVISYITGEEITWSGLARSMTDALGITDSIQYIVDGYYYDPELGELALMFDGVDPNTIIGKAQGIFEKIKFRIQDGLLKVGTKIFGEDGIKQVLTVASYLQIAWTIYSVVKILMSLIFQCTEEDFITAAKKSLRLCHKAGEFCDEEVFFGICLREAEAYCCFNSILARIVHEQGRQQIGRGWLMNGARDPDCRGFTPAELASLDWSRIDLTEYLQYLMDKINEQLTYTEEKIQNVTDAIQSKIGCTPSGSVLDPMNIDIEVTHGDNAGVIVFVKNNCGGIITNNKYVVSVNDSWITLTYTQDSVGFKLFFNVSGFAIGEYTTAVTVHESEFNNTLTLPIKITIVAPQ